MRIRCVVLAFSMLVLLFLAASSPAYAQGKTVEVPRRDIDITIEKNGDVRVSETWSVNFVGGPFTFAYRGITLNQVRAIDSFIVSDEGRTYQPSSSHAGYTYDVYQESGQQFVRWYFPSATDETHTFKVQYTLHGAMRLHDQADEFYWKIVEPERQYVIPIAAVTLHLPESFDASQIRAAVTSGNGQALIKDGQTLEFTSSNLYPGIEMEIRAAFPHGAIIDRAPTFNLAFIFVSFMLLLLGPVVIFLWWYVNGRDAPTHQVALTTAPPDNLPPGLVGTLLDEHADVKDITGTIVDLARRGVINISQSEMLPSRAGCWTDCTLRLRETTDNLRTYEQMLVRALFGDKSESSFTDLAGQIQPAIPAIQWEMYDEVTALGYFVGNPRQTRIRSVTLGIVALIALCLVGYVLWKSLQPYGDLGYLPGLALALNGLGLVILSPHMPRRTARGAAMKARCEAFRRYLDQINTHNKLNQAKELFDKYLPYAIVFGLHKSWVQQFADVGASVPSWYRVEVPSGHGGAGSGSSSSGSGPSLNAAAARVFTRLDSVTAELNSMLNSTSFILAGGVPGSGGSGTSGGSWGGGGGGSGGGGGGGSSGFG